jgi:polyferredoxin
MKRHSGWLAALGFLAIIWSEHAFDMTSNPQAAAMLLLALMSGAVLLSVIYQRETWCRYLCPLGNLGALYATPAMITIRANPSVCSTFCKTHECYKGTAELPGCPVFHHPLYARDAHFCKSCCTCLWTCPHNSARLYLRLPLQSIWRQADLGGDLLPFAIFLFLFAPIMLASQSPAWTASPGGFTVNALLAVALTVIFLRVLPRLVSFGGKAGQDLRPRVAFALLVLAWGPAMAYQLHHIRSLASLHIHADAGSFMARFFPPGEVSMQLVLQLGVIGLATLCAAVCLWGIRWRAKRDDVPVSAAGWKVLAGLCAAYVVAAVMLVLPRGVFL